MIQELQNWLLASLTAIALILVDPVSGIHDVIYCTSGPCGPGYYLSKTYRVCLPCPENTHMPKHNHHCFSCAHCTKPRAHHHEIAAKNCTATTDTEIACEPGFYMQSFSYHRNCKRCSECQEDEFEMSPCWGRNDTSCTPKKLRQTPTDFQADIKQASDGDNGKSRQNLTNQTTGIHSDRKSDAAATNDRDASLRALLTIVLFLLLVEFVS